MRCACKTTRHKFQPQPQGASTARFSLSISENSIPCAASLTPKPKSIPSLMPPPIDNSSQHFKMHKVDLVVMEACGPSGWIYDLAQNAGHKTIFCSTNEDAWKWSNVKRKTDKDDGFKLARMASHQRAGARCVDFKTDRTADSVVCEG